jgi:hypothetical protein
VKVWDVNRIDGKKSVSLVTSRDLGVVSIHKFGLFKA